VSALPRDGGRLLLVIPPIHQPRGLTKGGAVGHTACCQAWPGCW
jgi:hypothetical protein